MKGSVFMNNRTQAVRLPKGVAFPESVREVDVSVLGRGRVLVPGGQGWQHWFAHGSSVSDDFLASRSQPATQEREVW